MDTAIVLAGGFGTRLQSVVQDIPKPMADINGKPFLYYVLQYLKKYGIKNVILCVGYKHEVIEEYFHDEFDEIKIFYSVEDEPLGTGGAIKKAVINFQNISTSLEYLVLNGDTFFDVNLTNLYSFHTDTKSQLTIALKEMHDFDRFGTVSLDENRIIGFEEKKFHESGFINGGVYLINKFIFDALKFPNKFSLEKDFLEPLHTELPFYGFKSDGYFIDIGIPEEYFRAQDDLKTFK